MDSERILKRFYGIRPRRRRLPSLRDLRERAVDWVRAHNWRLVWVSLLLTGVVVVHVYYYNVLTTLEYDVKVARANLEASQLRRNHIQRNMKGLLSHYSEYERDVMGELTRERMRKGGDAPPKDSSQGLLGRLRVLAEQYPDLKLTNSSQQLGTAVVQSENDITQRIVEYNGAVNAYTTMLSRFPGNVVGTALGFRQHDFYSPKNRSKLEYEELRL